MGQIDEAIAKYRLVIELSPQFREATLGFGPNARSWRATRGSDPRSPQRARERRFRGRSRSARHDSLDSRCCTSNSVGLRVRYLRAPEVVELPSCGQQRSRRHRCMYEPGSDSSPSSGGSRKRRRRPAKPSAYLASGVRTDPTSIFRSRTLCGCRETRRKRAPSSARSRARCVSLAAGQCDPMRRRWFGTSTGERR